VHEKQRSDFWNQFPILGQIRLDFTPISRSNQSRNEEDREDEKSGNLGQGINKRSGNGHARDGAKRALRQSKLELHGLPG
jgi:hypothetical protein